MAKVANLGERMVLSCFGDVLVLCKCVSLKCANKLGAYIEGN